MYDTKKGVRREFHTHKSLEQILICIHCSCKVLLDNGKERKKFFLNRMKGCIFIMMCGVKCIFICFEGERKSSKIL